METLTLSPEVTSVINFLRKKSYFLRKCAWYGDSRAVSSEATRIVKNGEISLDLLNSVYGSEANCEAIRNLGKIDKQNYSCAVFELRSAFRRLAERNKVKTGKTIFADILAEVYEYCAEKFDRAWSKEVSRQFALFNSFVAYSDERTFDLSDDRDFRNSFENFFFSRISKATSLRTAKETERNLFYEELSFYRKVVKEGFENVIAEKRAGYLSFLTANLMNALAKHLPVGTAEISSVSVTNDVKGYSIGFDAYRKGEEGEHFSDRFLGRVETRSIPVDGPIVRFHFRYITSVYRKNSL